MTSHDVARPSEDPPYSQAPDWMLTAPVSMQAKLLYWALLAHVNRKRGDDKCWPSMDALAEMLGLRSRQSVSRYVDELREFGAIDVHRAPKSTRRANVYTVHRTPPAAVAVRSVQEWHRARYDRLDAAESPTSSPRDVGTVSGDDAGTCSGDDTNHPNPTHRNEPLVTTPPGENVEASARSQARRQSQGPRPFRLHTPRRYRQLSIGKATQGAMRVYAAALEHVGRAPSKRGREQAAAWFKRQLDNGRDRDEVWSEFKAILDDAYGGGKYGWMVADAPPQPDTRDSFDLFADMLDALDDWKVSQFGRGESLTETERETASGMFDKDEPLLKIQRTLRRMISEEQAAATRERKATQGIRAYAVSCDHCEADAGRLCRDDDGKPMHGTVCGYRFDLAQAA